MRSDEMTIAAGTRGSAGPRRPRRIRRLRRSFSLVGCCFAIASVVLILAVFGPLLAPQSPSAQHLSLVAASPSTSHWLGTDSLGRDVFSRIIYGAKLAVLGPLCITVGSFAIGNLLGLWAGYRRGWVDAAVMRWVDLMWSIPTLLVLVVVAGGIGSNYWASVGLLVILTAPFDTRVIRGATLEQTPRPYVEAAKTLGVRDRRIMLQHIWPNVMPVAVANSFLIFASSLVALAGLSYLGLGAPPGTPDWGLMLSENQSLLFANPVATLAPGAIIVITATATNLIGDWLDERMSGNGVTR